ncbi:lysine N(6)-hydroxylase/L-ornithine N(5)-oxygenase family protein [Halobacillus litoralis]|uniref:lysine N(6)-hydroxylase/L-ornithine N(5)-oxygenase family protein n=1 Tax=Halobacillus litoralis TaxID=45668 RepID=UPI001CD2FEF8|nr:lysine N(6)-hydroxylase/L-ornithine N(5)-oxygenase family protein [Halobacillus litoralis]MCA1020729.1 lysine N(6)-hydroxylase/L-ornithine N(5)-oxygenase family protein [Halobacillus litoralis]
MEQPEKVYDLIGVGTGPFNLSLAALSEPLEDVEALFFEKQPAFEWHPGMLIEGTKMQVPFLADLVTMADPTNPYSFLNYINKQGRMYPFYFLQRLDIPRREYNDYCQWAAEQLSSCVFGKEVVGLTLQEEKSLYAVEVQDVRTQETRTYYAENLVLGTGSVPVMPASFREVEGDGVFHTSEFLNHYDRCRNAESITVVGSGQSAAETFRELLKEQRNEGYRLDWITRSPGFESMEESKLSLEHFSPDYVDYFYQLPQKQKDDIFAGQGLYYKGISNHTITDIYNLLYEHTVGQETLNVGLKVLSEINRIHRNEAGHYTLEGRHIQKDETFSHDSEVVIAATGYQPYVPDFVKELTALLEWDDDGRYKVTEDYRLVQKNPGTNHIYVHSGISHTHGVGSTNLGLSVHRNKVIINHLTNRDVYPLNETNVFQTFDV